MAAMPRLSVKNAWFIAAVITEKRPCSFARLRLGSR